MNSIMTGEKVDPHNYDFYMHIFLETGDERYTHGRENDFRYWWVNKATIVARAVRASHGIAYDAYELVTKQA